jgi:hypothetical protein
MASNQEAIQQLNRRYLITTLPKAGSVFTSCVEKYRELRCQALTDSPETLAGSIKIEKALPYSHFADLISHPKRYIIVAIHSPADVILSGTNDEHEALIRGTWVGMLHVLGPLPLAEWTWPNLGGLRSDLEETKWHSYNGFIAPDHRGQLLHLVENAYHDLCVDVTRRFLATREEDDGRMMLSIRQKCCLSPEARARGLYALYIRLGWRETGYITADESLKAKELGYRYQDDAIRRDRVDHMVMERVFRVNREHGAVSVL